MFGRSAANVTAAAKKSVLRSSFIAPLERD
jgi:hypothetical protein